MRTVNNMMDRKQFDAIPEMIPIKEVTNRTGLPYNYIRTLCLDGEIVHVRTGRKYLINWGRFCDYLDTAGTKKEDGSDN